LSSSSLEPKTQIRNRLFYDRWCYCFKAYQPEFFCLRRLDHAHIDHVISIRKDWGKRMASRQPGSWYWSSVSISDQDQDNLHAMCDWLLQDTRPRKLVISGSWFYIYTDRRDLVHDLANLPWLDASRMGLTQVQLAGDPGTITLQQPRYQLRSYFRSLFLEDKRRENLVQILRNQELIRLGPALQRWADHGRHSRTYDYYFIDHDDMGIITLLSLIEPRLIRRTLPIVADK
jgi:hypothetical protein